MSGNQGQPEEDGGKNTEKKLSSDKFSGEEPHSEFLPNDINDYEEGENVTEGLLAEREVKRQEAELTEDFAKPATLEGDSYTEKGGDYAMSREPVAIPLEEMEAMETATEGIEEGLAKKSMMEASVTEYDEEDIGLEFVEGPPPQDRGLGATFAVPEGEIEGLPGEPQDSPPVPPPTAMRGAPLFSEAAFLAPGPMPGVEVVDAPELSSDLAPTKKMLDKLVTDERVDKLWDRAETAQKVINDKIFNLTLARQLLDQIRSAKTLLLADRANYEEAERALNEVEFRIAYSERTKRWSDSLAFIIMIYEVVWLIVFISIFFLLVIRGGINLAITSSDLITPEDVYNALGGMLLGGVGGVIGALYALWRYVSNDEFNPQHRIWYYAQPIMGIPIGVFIFLFLQIGFNIAAGSTQTIQSPFMVYLLAFIAGFQQNVIYDIVRQVLKLFKIGGDSDRSVSQEEEQEDQF